MQIVVALPPAIAHSPPEWLAPLTGERLRLVAGGTTRARSVAAALAALDPRCGIVLVHDAARPFVSRETIDRVIAAAEKGQGAVAAVPVYDTIKTSSKDGRVSGTVDRRGLWRAQTPQGFPRELLERAYRKMESAPGGPDPSDDAQAAERAGFEVVLVPDLTTNIKITTAEDFLLAEALASR
jgi:2-C-methyl-D-erythritol 4-phosphate cytidylyltransferase